MSVLRSFATFIFTLLFITLTFTAINSYTVGDLIQKENLKNFVKNEMMPDLISQQCESSCAESTEESCLEDCLSSFSNQTQGAIDSAINEVYERRLLNLISLSDITTVLSQKILLLILSIIFGVSILITSTTPLISLGKAMISISISLFVSGLSPNFVIGTSMGGLPFIENIFNYLSSGLEQQIHYGIIFLVIGIVLLLLTKIKKKK